MSSLVFVLNGFLVGGRTRKPFLYNILILFHIYKNCTKTKHKFYDFVGTV